MNFELSAFEMIPATYVYRAYRHLIVKTFDFRNITFGPKNQSPLKLVRIHLVKWLKTRVYRPNIQTLSLEYFFSSLKKELKVIKDKWVVTFRLIDRSS